MINLLIAMANIPEYVKHMMALMVVSIDKFSAYDCIIFLNECIHKDELKNVPFDYGTLCYALIASHLGCAEFLKDQMFRTIDIVNFKTHGKHNFDDDKLFIQIMFDSIAYKRVSKASVQLFVKMQYRWQLGALCMATGENYMKNLAKNASFSTDDDCIMKELENVVLSLKDSQL